MKTNKILSAILIGALSITAISCNKDSAFADLSVSTQNEVLVTAAEAVTITGMQENSVILYAGQTINVGTISFNEIDTDNNNIKDALKATYTLTNGWEISDVALWIGSSLSTLPANKAGNPVIGQFPFKTGSFNGSNEYSIVIPFSYLNYVPGDVPVNYYVAAHATVKKLNGTTYQSETAWGSGLRIVSKGSWATYFSITLSKDVVKEPEVSNTETAFAYSPTYSSTFESITGNNERWGWSNGPLSAGTFNFTIYAGAGNNDISKGKAVGVLTVVYNGSSALVSYNLNFPYKLKEAHLYAGNSVLPVNKQEKYVTAPGQYPNVDSTLDSSSHSYNVTGLSGQIYIVAHATVSGF
ncbi:MAG: hypothetical protein Q8S04_04835 [Bacteroidales bacterium]|nr:hypothetical protein [Bacteroidales bacterium]